LDGGRGRGREEGRDAGKGGREARTELLDPVARQVESEEVFQGGEGGREGGQEVLAEEEDAEGGPEESQVWREGLTEGGKDGRAVLRRKQSVHRDPLSPPPSLLPSLSPQLDVLLARVYHTRRIHPPPSLPPSSAHLNLIVAQIQLREPTTLPELLVFGEGGGVNLGREGRRERGRRDEEYGIFSPLCSAIMHRLTSAPFPLLPCLSTPNLSSLPPSLPPSSPPCPTSVGTPLS